MYIYIHTYYIDIYIYIYRERERYIYIYIYHMSETVSSWMHPTFERRLQISMTALP